MRFSDIVCSEEVANKLWSKHRVDLSEVDEVLQSEPHVRRGRDGLYYVHGRTGAGRYLFVVLSVFAGTMARVVTARDMDESERRLYRQQGRREW